MPIDTPSGLSDGFRQAFESYTFILDPRLPMRRRPRLMPTRSVQSVTSFAVLLTDDEGGIITYYIIFICHWRVIVPRFRGNIVSISSTSVT